MSPCVVDGYNIASLNLDCRREVPPNLMELKERIERVKEKSGKDGVITKDGEFSDEVMGIRKDFVAIHGEMVLLKNYSSLNFAGLVKILKKFDKRTGRLLRLPFTQLALDQPFFVTEPLNRLVRECEENLELLFPLEAEVVESDATAEDATGGTTPNTSNVSPSLSLGEENVDIYRSTLAAIKAIQGLKKASSTYNPLSFSYIFGNQDNDNTGAITAENSDSDPFVASQSDKETDQEDSNPLE
ncbi:SPX domain-containing protein 4 [Capsicum annuum]|uniref:SPX domain-containing protein 4 n=1 Tax=Capsicum annuum TaxID=4072 RepID=A0A2G3ACE3_CAPAN|nr:SPX domain-containing protein 4 [Capsicum annuum]